MIVEIDTYWDLQQLVGENPNYLCLGYILTKASFKLIWEIQIICTPIAIKKTSRYLN